MWSETPTKPPQAKNTKVGNRLFSYDIIDMQALHHDCETLIADIGMSEPEDEIKITSVIFVGEN